jgi:hypothetical protein
MAPGRAAQAVTEPWQQSSDLRDPVGETDVQARTVHAARAAPIMLKQELMCRAASSTGRAAS